MSWAPTLVCCSRSRLRKALVRTSCSQEGMTSRGGSERRRVPGRRGANLYVSRSRGRNRGRSRGRD